MLFNECVMTEDEQVDREVDRQVMVRLGIGMKHNVGRLREAGRDTIVGRNVTKQGLGWIGTCEQASGQRCG